MFISLSNFFKPKLRTYSYPYQLENVKSHIENIIIKDPSFWATKDISGSFIDGETFEMRLISPAYFIGWNYKVKLTGRVEAVSNTTTTIHTEIKSRGINRIIFFIALVSGLVFFITGLVRLNLQEIIIGFSYSIFLPGICVWACNMYNAALEKRYMLYIHEPLLSMKSDKSAMPH